MRKVLSVVLAATMVMSLAACGGSGAKTDTKAADAGTAAGDEASAMITTSPSSFQRISAGRVELQSQRISGRPGKREDRWSYHSGVLRTEPA